MLLITKLMNTSITMVSQILHSKNVTKIIKRISDIDHIWPLQTCLSTTVNLVTLVLCLQPSFQLLNVSKVAPLLMTATCLSEKAFIIRNLDDVNMLNKRSEFISKCWHINELLLIRVKDDSNDLLYCVFVFTLCFLLLTKSVCFCR